MSNTKPRIKATVYVATMPTVTCDEEGLLFVNDMGDEVHSWRTSIHKGLGIAALISAAVARWEREAKRDNVAPFKPKGMV